MLHEELVGEMVKEMMVAGLLEVKTLRKEILEELINKEIEETEKLLTKERELQELQELFGGDGWHITTHP